MDEIKDGNFPESRSRQEMYLQDIIKSLSNESISNGDYPDPRSRQEAYLQIIISKLQANNPSGEITTEDIEKALKGYFEQNPIQLGATEDQAKQIEKNKTNIETLNGSVSELDADIKKAQTSIGLLGKETNSLKESKIDKPAEAPVVGTILKVKSVNEDGTFICEWGEGGSNLDVQIDGKSITKDGVASIPAHKSKSTRNDFGTVAMGVDGDVRTYRNSLGEIGYRYLPLNSIDLAVKVAMCDGKGAAWTDTEKTGAWSRLASIKTAMDDIAVANAQYYLTEQTELTITLPDDALPGQEITIVWYNGDSATNLSIDGNILDFDYVPSANARSELSCLWDGTYWCLICNEQSVPSKEAANE